MDRRPAASCRERLWQNPSHLWSRSREAARPDWLSSAAAGKSDPAQLLHPLQLDTRETTLSICSTSALVNNSHQTLKSPSSAASMLSDALSRLVYYDYPDLASPNSRQ